MAWGLSAQKCVVIHNGQVDLGEKFDRKRHSATLNRFGFFGQFIDNKGIDIVLKALLILAQEKRLPQAGIVFEINGANKHYATSTYLQEVTGLLDQLAPFRQNPITIIDRERYTREELAERMGLVDWVLVPSTWWEVFGLVVSEAWMFGRPVIAADIGGLGERVTNGTNGFTFSARDARGLADLMLLLIGNTAKWRQVNATLPRNWSEVDMLNAHLAIWEERS